MVDLDEPGWRPHHGFRWRNRSGDLHYQDGRLQSMMVDRLSLQPLSAARVERIEHWFDNPEVRHRLGDRSWIHRELRLIGERPGTMFRGMLVLRSYGWVALDRRQTPVAFVGGDVYDRWARYHGEGEDGPIISEVDLRRSMSLAYVVYPARWRRGFGTATLKALLDHPDVSDVELFFCGVDADNHASRRLATSAGFHLVDPHPDHEDILYFRYERAHGLE